MLLLVTHGSAFCSQQASYVRVGVWLTVVKEIHADISRAWLITVTYSAVPLAYLCGIYPHSSWPIIVANTIFLSVLVSVRGNVARLVDHLRQ